MSTNYKKVWKQLSRLGRRERMSALPFILVGAGLGAVAIGAAAVLALNPKARTEAQRLVSRVGEMAQQRLLTAQKRTARVMKSSNSEVGDAPNGVSSSYSDTMSNYGS